MTTGQKNPRCEYSQTVLRDHDTCDEAGYLKHSAPNGWLPRVNHFGDHYDHIHQILSAPVLPTMLPPMNPAQKQKWQPGVDDIMQTMTEKSLLLSGLAVHHRMLFSQYALSPCDNRFTGTFLLSIAALILYAGYLALCALCIVRSKRRCASENGVCTKKKARPEVMVLAGLLRIMDTWRSYPQ